MAQPNTKRVDLDEVTDRSPNASVQLDLQKLRTEAAQRAGRGNIWKVARLIAICTIQYDANSTTLTGAVAGSRFFEAVSLAQLKPRVWPGEYAFWCGGKALRRRALYLRGHLPVADPSDQADSAATDSTARAVLYFDFWRPRQRRPEDYCPAALDIGDGTLQVQLAATESIPGINYDNVDIKLVADIFPGNREIPAFVKFSEHDIPSANRFPFGVSPDALLGAFLHVRGGESTNTHLAGDFDESRTIQISVGGERLIEDRTLQELVEDFNAAHLLDGADRETPSKPLAIPFWWDGDRLGVTKPPSMANDGYIEVSGEIRGTVASTTPISLALDQLYNVQEGAEHTRKYGQTVLGLTGEQPMHRATVSKARSVVNSLKAQRIPAAVTRPPGGGR